MEFASHKQPPAEWVPDMDAWVAWMRVKRYSRGTIENWWYQVSQLARSSGKPPTSVRTEDIMAWVGRGVGTEAMRAGRSAASCFFKWMQAMGRREDDPSKLVPTVRREKRKKAPATDEAAIRGLFHPDPRVRLMVRMVNDTGMRRSEIAVSHSRDLVGDLLGMSLMVHGKGAKDRLVPLSDGLAHLLRQRPEGYFFPGDVDGHVCSDTVYRLIKDATGYPPHAFRRKFATETWKATNGDVLRVQELLGHSSLDTTQNYVTATAEDLRQAIRSLVEWRDRKSVGVADPYKLLAAYGVPPAITELILKTAANNQKEPDPGHL